MMNKYTDRNDQFYYHPRWLANKIRDAIDVNPVIVLTGARQTGKSTFIANEKPFADWRYLTFDDLDVLGQAKRDANSLLSVEEDTVIDEVQRAPEILLLIKRIVDKNRKRRFILSGSANLLLMKKITETLAGRATYFVLLPFSLKEWQVEKPSTLFSDLLKGVLPKERKYPKVSPIEYIFCGFLPPVLSLNGYSKIATWWEGYVKTYLERDLRDLSNVSSLSDFKKLMEICAIKSGSILNEMDISRICGLSQPTVHRYINLLEASHLFIKVKPYTKGRLKRIIKAPKGYFLDPGLVSYLAGYNTPESIPIDFQGFLFESLILLNLKIYAALIGGEVYYWRTWGGKEKEVDFVLEANRRLLAIEVKLAERVGYADAINIKTFMENHQNVCAGLIVYTGSELNYLEKNIVAVPWTAF